MSGLRQRIRETAKKLIPGRLLSLRKRWLLSKARRKFARLSTAEAFSRIYRNRLWGEESNELFDSGRGSVSVFTEQYSQFIRGFVRVKGIKKIVDLGCGSFQVGRLLARAALVWYNRPLAFLPNTTGGWRYGVSSGHCEDRREIDRRERSSTGAVRRACFFGGSEGSIRNCSGPWFLGRSTILVD